VFFNITRKLKYILVSENILLKFHISLSVCMFHLCIYSVNYVKRGTSPLHLFILGKDLLPLLVTINRRVPDKLHCTEGQSSFERLAL
jgi:hypothetical protein